MSGFNGQQYLIPLSGVNIIGNLLDNLGKINCEFVFVNNYSNVINPIHYFSLDPNATICNFTMLVGTKVLKGEVQEKTQARQTYSQAQSEGKKTALIEKISSTDYKVSVGNVEPGLTVFVSFDYIISLETDDFDRYIFSIPTNVSVKSFCHDQTEKDIEYSKQISQLKYSTDTNYSFFFDIRWYSSNNFLEFESNVETIKINQLEPSKLQFVSETKPSNQDFKLFVKTDFKPSSYLWVDQEPNSELKPNSNSDSELKSDTKLNINNLGYFLSNIKIPDEIIGNSELTKKNYQFILDRSGSMGGLRIKKAIEALKLFIELIPSNSYFNVISFGSNYTALWSKSVPANGSFRQDCLLDIESYNGDMGGTELYNCLEDCLDYNLKKFKIDAKSVSCPKSYENVIVVLTDGEVISNNEIFNMVTSKNAANNTRIFSIGLGDGASKQFIKGISDLTYGDYMMVGDHGDLLVPIKKIISVINKQFYRDVKIISKSVDNIVSIHNTNINALYPGKTYSIVLKIESENIDKFNSGEMVISGIDPIDRGQEKIWNIRLTNMSDDYFNNYFDNYFDYSILKKIYSNELIKNLTKSLEFDLLDMKQKSDIKNQIIKLSIQDNIMNEYTSFVLVDKSTEYDFGNDFDIGFGFSHGSGIDVIVPNSSLTNSSRVKSIGINSILDSKKNISINQTVQYVQSQSSVCFSDDISNSSSNNYNIVTLGSVSIHNGQDLQGGMDMWGGDDIEYLQGGMDMWGGDDDEDYCGWTTYSIVKHSTDINWLRINQLLNHTNGSFKFENDSWKLLCFLNQEDFDANCKKAGLTRVLFYNFIILLELIKLNDQRFILLKEYFEYKYPGMFNSKKHEIEQMYSSYINYILRL
jgi:hypothetical protein